VKVDVETFMDDTTNKASLHFIIREGFRMKIKRINVYGNTAYRDNKIIKAMKSRPAWLFNSGFLKEEEHEFKRFYRLSSWWVNNRGRVHQAGLGLFFAFDFALVAFAGWTFLDGFAVSYARERLAVAEMVAYGQGDLHAQTVAGAAQPLEPGSVTVLALEDGAVDAYAPLVNPNQDWWAEITYTFRSGMIDDGIADLSNVGGVDAKFQLNDVTTAKAEIAVSEREKELLTNEFLKNDVQGYAYRGIIDSKFEHRAEGETDLHLSVTQMDENFDPVLSRYTNTRDDHFWGKTLSFIEYSPDLEYFRIGDGIDVNRLSVRLRWREKLFKDRFMNLFDVRNVHKASNYAYKETVIREEMTYKVNSQLTAKGMFRWHGLPETTRNVEPFIANFYVADVVDPVFQNVEIKEDLDADRFTYAGGLQYQINKQWTAEGILQVSNDIPDFPRGLLNGVFRDANDRIDSVLTDHLTNFLYGQGHLGATPPYEYFTVTKERIIYKPEDKVTVTFHAAQNGYKYAGGIDDNINHQGVSVAYDYSEKLSLFVDVSHMNVIDLPKLIATNYVEHDFRDHYNFYASADYRISSHQLFRAEYGVLGLGADTPQVTPYSTTGISFPTIDTEHLLRVSLTGEF
jgi:hypothetical protein